MTRHVFPPSAVPIQRDILLARGEIGEWVKKAPLFYVGKGMSELVEGRFGDMPGWTPHLCAPTPSGFMLIHLSVPSDLEAYMGRPVPPTPMLFGWRTCEDGLIVEQFIGEGGEREPHCTQRVKVPADCTLPIDRLKGRAYSREELLRMSMEDAVDVPVDSLAGYGIVSMLGCAWVLMGQENTAVAAPREVRGKKSKRGSSVKEMVQVINLRPSLPSGTAVAERGEREYTVRWWVKGHWRQQRFGPNRQWSKPVYIQPQIRGPKDAPLKQERVYKWTR